MKPKNIIFDIGGVLIGYNKETLNNFLAQKTNTNPFILLESGIKILEECYQQKNSANEKLHKLYVLSNWKQHSFEHIKNLFPNIFKMFDGILLSSDVGHQKPDIRIYLNLISKFNIDPSNSIFIDDQIENIESAQTLGINGILYDHPEKVKVKLKELRVI